MNDDNYFLWEFSARMALARKGLAGHVEITPEKAVALSSNEMWKTADSKAMGVIAKMLSSPYQAMIRNAKFAVEAWIILQQFHVKRSLHNRVQLRKQLHELVMNPGDNIMDHLLKFDDVCMRLDAVGDNVKDDEQLVVLLGSLPPEYDAIVKIIEARGNVDLYEAKEMLRREYETLQKRERQEAAFKSAVVHYDGRGRNGGRGKSRNGKKNKRQDRGQSGFQGRCFDCNKLVLANGNTAVVKDVLYIPGLDRNGDEHDSGKPDPKRLRLTDGYEIALAVMEIPRTYKEAMASSQAPKWKEAIRRELRSHFRNHTWDAVRRPQGVREIGCKWVYGVDFWETYSPVASLNSVRAFLAFCCMRRYVIRQLDVETAFLNGKLEEDVYMRPPEGVKLPEGMICKLQRSIYGLRQAAAVWHNTIKGVLREMGFDQCRSDQCVFVRRDGEDSVFLVLYVDDLLIGCSSDDMADKIKMQLAEHFALKDLGDARFVLGIEVAYDRSKGNLHICQSQFIQRLMEKFGQESASPVRNPNVVGQRLEELSDGDMVEVKRYRELIGSLLYVASGTRPDICVSICELSQYSPTPAHMKAAIRVLRYLGGREVLWLRHLLTELGVLNMPPTVIYVDNQAAIAMAEHSGYQSRAKHIDLRYHFVRDTIESGELETKYVRSKDQLADFMTKAMPTPQFTKLVQLAGIRDDSVMAI
ncbi:hypothetical protein P43SY_002015 [Pythium insidiosum]|uniref:Reverse transcriptase Ty1/copia-type domain-containing protein n=1 Tax=Pythium insidiosum TaxID=114742 RepID=A0AAD5L815_PYTIN|nr:hypothetical protein P43SY_002015 [Pythium insidiosum]